MILNIKLYVVLRQTHGRGKKLSKPKIQKQSEDNIIRSIRNRFKLRKENEIIKYRVIRDIRTLFEQEEDYYKPIRVGNFCILNMKVTVIEIKFYQ